MITIIFLWNNEEQNYKEITETETSVTIFGDTGRLYEEDLFLQDINIDSIDILPENNKVKIYLSKKEVKK
jgi:hypothetical protein